MLQRTVLLGLLSLGVAAMSCQFLPTRQHSAFPAKEPSPLPAVSAAPTGDAAKRAQLLAATQASSAQVEAIRTHLEAHHTGLSSREIVEVAQVIVAEAHRHGFEPGLVLAVIQVESSCYHRAVSSVGAMGLMQILPSTGEELAGKLGIDWYGSKTLFDPIVNVKLGVAYLKELSERFEHVPATLAAYNWGPGRISRRLRRGAALPKIYVQQVMRAYDTVGGLRTSS